MASKQGGKGGAAAGKAKKAPKAGADDKGEDVLQAVVLADSFQDRFLPFTLERPRCLLPLAGVPVIEYTLEFLASNGVQDVFIYCGAHSEEIETYIYDSKRWNPNSATSPFSSLEFIRVSDATSIGDFLRDLDKRGLVSGDFLLVHGDLVANVPLDDALAKHRARREANRDACMTMVLRSLGDERHRAEEARVIKPVFVLDSENGRCLQYDEIHPLQTSSNFMVDPSVFQECPDFAVRADLMDCGIDICTPEVLALWSESFDYELPRRNFLHGVLKDFELNGKTIYTEVIDNGYAARASNLGMYECISRDIIGRWTFPYVPDSNLVQGQTFRRTNQGTCLEDKAIVDRGAHVTKSVIGAGSTVNTGTSISKSIIGRRCRIGKNVKITNSYIWDDVVIEDNSVISRSILADNVTVGNGCRIPEGSLLSFGVHIADDTQLPKEPTPRISVLTHNKTAASTDDSLVGPGGKGAMYQDPEEEDAEDSDEDANPAILMKTLFYSLEGMNLSQSSISTLASDDEYDDGDDGGIFSPALGADGPTGTRNRLSSFASLASDDSAALASSVDAFHGDAVHGLVDALRADENEDFDSAKLEFMGLRLANDASDNSMRRAIAVAFVRRAAELLKPEHGGLEPTKAAERAFTSKKGAVKFIKEVGVGGDKTNLQAEFALAMQKALLGIKGLEAARAGALLAAMLQQMYSLDVLEEDGILAWWRDARASENEGLTKLREKCKVLVEWLENADEEESEEDEDSD
ncbi:nucleotide-diphospho-sugar transferase [Podospora conica]|nr:nucleotide-diphospho-sugar transferase [Schizothecium conicum]